MRALRDLLDRIGKPFQPGGKLERFYPLYEAADTFFYSPASVTRTGAHVRDAMDLKRMMILVVIATLPCVLMALYNTGLQANLAINPAKVAQLEGWRHAVLQMLGVGYSPDSLLGNMLHGALYFVPLYLVTMVVGLGWEVLFSVVRKIEVNEGFFVTGMLFPLILPPTTPLWQAALAVSFGVVLVKEVFGGTGMNFMNPALAMRAFLFFAYPAAMSGDKVWTAVPPGVAVDGYSGATILGKMHSVEGSFADQGYSWWTAFVGLEPGSMGETSALACGIGALIIVATGVGSWRTMAAMCLGTIGMASLLNAVGSVYQPLVCRALLVAHGVGRLGLCHGVHGDRPRHLTVFKHRQVDLRHPGGRAGGADTGLQPGLPGIGDAGHPAHERGGAGHRLLHGAGQHPPQECTPWLMIPPVT
jgi:Na+-transporting NADH:ubiquinone oxidoreductase subunit B